MVGRGSMRGWPRQGSHPSKGPADTSEAEADLPGSPGGHRDLGVAQPPKLLMPPPVLQDPPEGWAGQVQHLQTC